MALPSININLFSGISRVTRDEFTEVEFAAAIDTLRNKHLLRLLGNAAYTDISENTRSRWATFFAGTTWTNDEGQLVTLFPVTQILVYLIYAEWIAKQRFTNSATGTVLNRNANSDRASGANIGAIGLERQSHAAALWNEQVRPFIEKFRVVNTSVVDVTNINGSRWRITTTGNPYLESGDTVTIAGVEWFVEGPPTATTFDIGTFSQPGQIGDEIEYKPFDLITTPTPCITIGTF